jgi:hypothetical protein
MNKEKYKLVITVDENGGVDISSEGVCHHIYLLGVLESIQHDIMNAAVDMSSALQNSKNGEGEEPNE